MASSSSSPVIVVIGSGLSGLSAAKMMIQCLPDCKVTILEALSRPGGRVNSVEITENEFMEEGATWIHGIQGNPISDLIKQQTFDDNQHYIAEKFCKRNGEEVAPEKFELFRRIYHKLRTKAEHLYLNRIPLQNGFKSVGDYLQKEFLREVKDQKLLVDCKNTASSVFHFMSQVECCISGCNSLFDLRLDDYGEYEDLEGGDLRVQGGYVQVVEGLLEKLPEGCVRYKSPVTEVHWNGDKPNEFTKPVSVLCENGDQYYADHVITTQSLGHLKENARTMFRPALPQVKLDIIDRMGFNYVTKIRLRYKTPFWQDTFTCVSVLWDRSPEEVVTKPSEFRKETWYKKIFEFAVHPLVSNTLEVWLSGESALHVETLEDDDISETCTDLLRSFLKDPTIPEPDEILTTSWNTNPYFRGAYSYVAVGSSGEDIDGLAEPLCVENSEGVNIQRVLFAGEATHRTFYSTTHGALLSGEREARRLINLYQCSSHK